MLISLLELPCVSAQSATTDWEKAAGEKMSFTVASVKQDRADPAAQTPNSNVPLGPQDAFTPTGGLFSAKNWPLLRYMTFAYKLTPDQIQSMSSQFPKWAQVNRYDVEARATGNPTKDQYRLMMQALLADRFKLLMKYESRDLPVFALVLVKPGKLGAHLQSYPTDGTPCDSSAATGTNGASSSAATIAGGFPLLCGGFAYMNPNTPGDMRIGARNRSMAVIATYLGYPFFGLDRPVLDKTGLVGTYDFVIEFSPDTATTAASEDSPRGPTFLEALKDQLGLKLESTTGPVQSLVIDHIEEPSPN